MKILILIFVLIFLTGTGKANGLSPVTFTANAVATASGAKTLAKLRKTAEAQPIKLTASWYNISSLHKDGQWAITKGRCADGSMFKDDGLTCANRLFPLGTMVRVTNTDNNKSVICKTTDRIGKRFSKTRIDLSPACFKVISPSGTLKEGLLKNCTVEALPNGKYSEARKLCK